MTLFGRIVVTSAYLYRPGQKGLRPTRARWGLHGGSRTPAVERALTDFGAEESFGQASRRFQEHYGFEVGRTTISKIVHAHAKRAEKYVEEKLAESKAKFDEPLSTRPGAPTLVVELDGCEIRTGTLGPSNSSTEPTPKRRLPRKTRTEAWRDIRVGLVRPLTEVTPTYVAKMAPYPEVVGQLFSAACARGLSSTTRVAAVGDGGIGLYEALAAQFAGLRFILDRPHAKHHLYEAADASGLSEAERHRWVSSLIVRLDMGKVQEVLSDLAAHKGRGKARVKRLHAYISRFKDAFNYDEAKKQGLPIGSGEVESAHRTIPQKRLKLPGAWWHPTSINPMLALRIVRANDNWDDFWRKAA